MKKKYVSAYLAVVCAMLMSIFYFAKYTEIHKNINYIERELRIK